MTPFLGKAPLFLAATLTIFGCSDKRSEPGNSTGGGGGAGGSGGTAGSPGDLPPGEYTLFSGGTIRTVDDTNTVAEAIVVRDGVIT